VASLYDEKVLGAKDRIALARKLQEKGDNIAAGQMVSGWYVPNTGGAALGALQNIIGAYQESSAREDLDKAEQEKTAASIRGLNSIGIEAPPEMALQAGTPEQKPAWYEKAGAYLTGNEQPQVIPAQPMAQNVAKNVSPEEMDRQSLALSVINPEVGAMAQTIGNNQANREAKRIAAQDAADLRRWMLSQTEQGKNTRQDKNINFQGEQGDLNRQNRIDIHMIPSPNSGGTPSYSSVSLPDGSVGVIDHRTGEIKPYAAAGGALGGGAKPFTDSEIASFGQLYKGQQAGMNPRIPAKTQLRYQEWLAKNGGDVNAIVSGSATSKAGTSALGAQTKQYEAAKNFSDTFDKNAQMALEFSDTVARTKSPIANQLIQSWQSSGVQNPELKSFKNATETAVNEYAKIMSGSTGSSAVSVAAAKHAREMLSTADSPETYKKAIQTLRREADNRLESFKTGTADISARLANPQQPVQQLVQQPVQQQMPTQPPVQQQAPVQQKQKFTSSGW
jgi:hypothetical protein